MHVVILVQIWGSQKNSFVPLYVFSEFFEKNNTEKSLSDKQKFNFLSSTVCIHDAYAYTWNMDLFIFVYACADFPGAKVVSEAVAKSGTSPLLPAITFILDKVYTDLPTPPFSAEDKERVAANVYQHVWQQALRGDSARAM